MRRCIPASMVGATGWSWPADQPHCATSLPDVQVEAGEQIDLTPRGVGQCGAQLCMASRFRCGSIRQPGDAVEAVTDLLGHRALLLGGTGDLFAHLTNLVDRTADGVERLVGGCHVRHAFFRLLPADIHGAYRTLGCRLKVEHHLLNALR